MLCGVLERMGPALSPPSGKPAWRSTDAISCQGPAQGNRVLSAAALAA